MGVVGVFLPLKPGVIFILLGSALLGSNNRLVMKAQRMVRKHFHRRNLAPQLKKRRRKNYERSNFQSCGNIMNLPLKQPKDVLVLFFGIAGLILVGVPPVYDDCTEKGSFEILAWSCCEDQNHNA